MASALMLATGMVAGARFADAAPEADPVRGGGATAGDSAVPRVGGGDAAATGAPAGSPDAEADLLTVQVLTFGPGSHPFTRFGHNAIRIVDRHAHTDIVYNFGTFTFDSPRLILDFLKGRLRYWLSRSGMRGTVRVYQRENRDIQVQELALSPAQKRELALRLEVNALPPNRDYRYDYFADNCSTRVRDALDVTLQGRLRQSAMGSGGMSLRAHALRMAADDLPLYVALLIVLGPRTDRPIDQWAETFLPEMLQRTLRDARTGRESPVGTGAATGTGDRLVKAEGILFRADRPPPAREAPRRFGAFLGVGMALGLFLWVLGRAGRRTAVARLVLGLLLFLAGLVFGGVGCFLAGAWALTPHAVVYENQNILLFAPFAIALMVFGPGAAFGHRGSMRKAGLISGVALGLALVACVLKLFPWPRQDNGALILLMLPVWAGITVATRLVAARDVTARSTATAGPTSAAAAADENATVAGGVAPS